MNAASLDFQVLEADVEVQKKLLPFLKVPALRTIIHTFSNDEEGNFQRWLTSVGCCIGCTAVPELMPPSKCSDWKSGTAFLA
jgi:hypothetical protein